MFFSKQKPVTNATNPVSVFAALREAANFMKNPYADWVSRDSGKAAITLFRYMAAQRDAIANLGVTDAAASANYNELNEWLAARNASPAFRSPFGPNSFGIVGLTDARVTFAEAGAITSICEDGTSNEYPAFSIDRWHRDVYNTSVGRVARLHTKTSGAYLWLTVPAPAEVSSTTLLYLHAVRTIHSVYREAQVDNDVDCVVAPMIYMPTRALDVEYTLGAYLTGSPAYISDANQLMTWAMDNTGAAAIDRWAAVVSMTITPDQPVDWVINRPFLAFITMPEAPMLPISPIYACPDVWAEPPDFSTLYV